MTEIEGPNRSARPLGITWLALGVPIGGLLGWLTQMSDRPSDRGFGTFLLVLALASLLLGIRLLGSSTARWLTASVLLSTAWMVAAAIVLVVADFTADRLWGAGLTGLVAVATGSQAAVFHRRQEPAQVGGTVGSPGASRRVT